MIVCGFAMVRMTPDQCFLEHKKNQDADQDRRHDLFRPTRLRVF